MFNRKRDIIKQLANDIEYYQGRVNSTQDYWRDRWDVQSVAKAELHELIVDRDNDIKALKQEARGYITTYLVSDIVYAERDEDGERKEIDRIERTFDNQADAVHHARNLRLNTEDNPNVSILLNKLELRKTALNSEGMPFGRLTESILYGSPFFATSV